MNASDNADYGDVEGLVKASRTGDKSAFGELVRLYQRKAMMVAVRILGDANEAADAVQAGFVKAYLSLGELKEPKRFEAWLLRIITNAAISQQRTAKGRVGKVRIADCYEQKKAASVTEKATAEELKEAIQQAMLKLSAKEAKAISLFGLEDLSHKEVAEIMGCSTEAVRWHVFKARQKLKVMLKEYL